MSIKLVGWLSSKTGQYPAIVCVGEGIVLLSLAVSLDHCIRSSGFMLMLSPSQWPMRHYKPMAYFQGGPLLPSQWLIFRVVHCLPHRVGTDGSPLFKIQHYWFNIL